MSNTILGNIDIDMKKLLLIAAAVFAFAACSDEKTGWGEQEIPNTEQMGYLNLADDALSVIIEQEVGNAEVGSGAESDTRAGDENYEDVTANDGYWIQIIDKDGNVVSSFSYADWLKNKTNVPGYVEETEGALVGKKGIKLPIGTYTVKATSVGNLSNVSYNAEYEGHTEVTIGKAEEKTVEVKCSLASVKVTVKFDEILANLIKVSGTTVAAKLGDVDGKISEYIFTGSVENKPYANVADLTTESYPVYLRPQNEGEGAQNPLNLYLTTEYDGNAINNQQLPVTKNAKRGEWRNVTIKLEHGNEGTVNFVVTVETIVNNETVNVDVQSYASNWGESGIPDVMDGPHFESVHYDLENAINPSSMFEGDVYQGPLMNLKSKSAVTAVHFSASSTNAKLNEAFVAKGFNGEGLNLMGSISEAAAVQLDSWSIPNGANAFVAATSDGGVPFSFKGFVETIYNNDEYTGLHTFTFKVEAGAGNVLETTIKIGTGGTTEKPVILWNNGANKLDTPTKLTSNLGLLVEIYTNEPISNIWVSIGGGLQTMLGTQLPSRFDLVNPNTTEFPALSETLNALGFPVGESVGNKTYVKFVIKDELKNTMMSLGEQGIASDAQFTIEVHAGEGETAESVSGAMMLLL